MVKSKVNFGGKKGKGKGGRNADRPEIIEFDEKNRKEFLTGFHKRKLQRRKKALEEKQKMEKEAKKLAKQQKKEKLEEELKNVRLNMNLADTNGAVNGEEEEENEANEEGNNNEELEDFGITSLGESQKNPISKENENEEIPDSNIPGKIQQQLQYNTENAITKVTISSLDVEDSLFPLKLNEEKPNVEHQETGEFKSKKEDSAGRPKGKLHSVKSTQSFKKKSKGSKGSRVKAKPRSKPKGAVKKANKGAKKGANRKR